MVFIGCKPPIDPVKLVRYHIDNVKASGITHTKLVLYSTAHSKILSEVGIFFAVIHTDWSLYQIPAWRTSQRFNFCVSAFSNHSLKPRIHLGYFASVTYRSYSLLSLIVIDYSIKWKLGFETIPLLIGKLSYRKLQNMFQNNIKLIW